MWDGIDTQGTKERTCEVVPMFIYIELLFIYILLIFLGENYLSFRVEIASKPFLFQSRGGINFFAKIPSFTDPFPKSHSNWNAKMCFWFSWKQFVQVWVGLGSLESTWFPQPKIRSRTIWIIRQKDKLFCRPISSSQDHLECVSVKARNVEKKSTWVHRWMERKRHYD